MPRGAFCRMRVRRPARVAGNICHMRGAAQFGIVYASAGLRVARSSRLTWSVAVCGASDGDDRLSPSFSQSRVAWLSAVLGICCYPSRPCPSSPPPCPQRRSAARDCRFWASTAHEAPPFDSPAPSREPVVSHGRSKGGHLRPSRDSLGSLSISSRIASSSSRLASSHSERQACLAAPMALFGQHAAHLVEAILEILLFTDRFDEPDRPPPRPAACSVVVCLCKYLCFLLCNWRRLSLAPPGSNFPASRDRLSLGMGRWAASRASLSLLELSFCRRTSSGVLGDARPRARAARAQSVVIRC